MKNIIFIFGVFLVLSVTACGLIVENERKPITGASSFYLSYADLNAMKEKALSGDAKAAFRLYQHYALGKDDIIAAFPWLQIAANGNDPKAQYSLGYTYFFVNLFKNIELAKFWLNAASINGSIKAKELLKEINSYENPENLSEIRGHHTD